MCEELTQIRLGSQEVVSPNSSKELRFILPDSTNSMPTSTIEISAMNSSSSGTSVSSTPDLSVLPLYHAYVTGALSKHVEPPIVSGTNVTPSATLMRGMNHGAAGFVNSSGGIFVDITTGLPSSSGFGEGPSGIFYPPPGNFNFVHGSVGLDHSGLGYYAGYYTQAPPYQYIPSSSVP